MQWAIQQIFEELLLLDEHQRIEAKRGSEMGHSVMQTICAFANEPDLGGGWLLLGVSEPDNNHDAFWVSGVDNVDKLLGELQNNCRNQFEQSVIIECKHAKIDEKSVIGVFVYELDPTAKPCRFIGKPDKHNKRKTGVWRRDANGDYECTERELEPILMAKAGLSYEQVILPDVSLDTLEANQLLGKLWQKYHLIEKAGSGRNTYYRATCLLLEGSNFVLNKQKPSINAQELNLNTQELNLNAQEFIANTQELSGSLREAIEALTPKTRKSKLHPIKPTSSLKKAKIGSTVRGNHE